MLVPLPCAEPLLHAPNESVKTANTFKPLTILQKVYLMVFQGTLLCPRLISIFTKNIHLMQKN